MSQRGNYPTQPIDKLNTSYPPKGKLTFGNKAFICSCCKHWKQNTFYDYDGAINDGFCSELSSELVIELKTGHDGGYVKSIETKGSFGCILFCSL